ncbi:unnamed protein product [Arctogadus glacialis]
MRQLLIVCPFTCRLTLFQHSFSTVIVNGQNATTSPKHMWDSFQGNSAKIDLQRVFIIPNTRSVRPRSPHCVHEGFWVDQACSGVLLYPFSGTTVVIDIQIPAVLG